MKRFYCAIYGETLFNSNGIDWRIGELAEALQSTKYFFYGRRIDSFDDDPPEQD